MQERAPTSRPFSARTCGFHAGHRTPKPDEAVEAARRTHIQGVDDAEIKIIFLGTVGFSASPQRPPGEVMTRKSIAALVWRMWWPTIDWENQIQVIERYANVLKTCQRQMKCGQVSNGGCGFGFNQEPPGKNEGRVSHPHPATMETQRLTGPSHLSQDLHGFLSTRSGGNSRRFVLCRRWGCPCIHGENCLRGYP